MKKTKKKKITVVASKKFPVKKLINVKILIAEKVGLKSQAKRYAGGNVTKLVRLLSRGYFVPRALKKKAA